MANLELGGRFPPRPTEFSGFEVAADCKTRLRLSAQGLSAAGTNRPRAAALRH
jgi:hypothetical protein